jgi:hypothetical protein
MTTIIEAGEEGRESSNNSLSKARYGKQRVKQVRYLNKYYFSFENQKYHQRTMAGALITSRQSNKSHECKLPTHQDKYSNPSSSNKFSDNFHFHKLIEFLLHNIHKYKMSK